MALHESCGWTYIARRGEFYVYRGENSQSPEPESDPAVQALTIRAVRRRRTAALLRTLFWTLLWPLLRLWRYPVMLMLTVGTGLTALAQRLAEEYLAFDRRAKSYEELPCIIPGTDWAIAYANELHFPAVIFRKGSAVVHATFYQRGNSHLPIETWTALLADSVA